MRSIIRNLFRKLFTDAEVYNKNNIINLLEKNHKAIFLDVGCDDGSLTLELSNKIKTKNIHGIDINNLVLKRAKNKGIKIKKGDINKKFGYPPNYFDVITANQVIEHLYDSDNFLSEIYRILKPGGYAVISTENASSWCNIFASIMGWQIFSLTNISSKKLGIGNPLAYFRDVKDYKGASWNHVRIYNIRGLKELMEVHGFKVLEILGAGYFPLPPIFGKYDKVHSHFMTFKLNK